MMYACSRFMLVASQKLNVGWSMGESGILSPAEIVIAGFSQTKMQRSLLGIPTKSNNKLLATCGDGILI